MDARKEQEQDDAALMVAARALWEDLAMRARGLHCPEHIVGPWRVTVTGDTRQALRLQVYGCCPKIGQVVTEMIRADARVRGMS